VVEVSGWRVRVVSAFCPEHICEAQGWIERPGEVIACVPNGVLVRIVGAGGEREVDGVTR